VCDNMHNAGFYYKVPILKGDSSHSESTKSATCVTLIYGHKTTRKSVKSQ